MHEADSADARKRKHIELGLLPDQRGDEIRIEAVGDRILAQIGPIGFRKKRFPIRARQGFDIDGEIVWRGALHDLDAGIVASTLLINAGHFGGSPSSALLAGSGLAPAPP